MHSSTLLRPSLSRVEVSWTTFLEASALARLSGKDLAILLLDFEKSYDRVDWGFLEGTMLCMGFSGS